MKLDLSFWTNASSKRKRIYSIIIIFILAFIITVIGSYIPLSHQDAQTLSNGVNATLNAHKSFGSRTEFIFFNNFFEVCLPMFVPIIGLIWGFLVMGNTGLALGAISSVQGYPVWIELLSLVLTPVFWLEFAAYSTAMAEGIWLTRRLMQRRWLELKNTAMLIGICAAILIVSAIIEVWLIAVLG
ncbi:MAG: hypothetical protein ABR909_10965 [Candidatus Bathyarchaeia archaeon]|jgi:hypothetical protein